MSGSVKVDLNPDNPHSPERTAELAHVAAEAVRVLNHATMPGRGGLAYPSDVCAVLSSLHELVRRIPQLCDQLGNWLAAENDAGRVRTDEPGGVVPIAVIKAHLATVAIEAGMLGHVLDEVHGRCASLAYADPHELRDGS